MRLVTTLLLMLFVLGTGYASEVTDEDVPVSETERLIDKYSSQLSATITALADTLEAPAEHIYSIMVKQQVVYAWVNLIVVLLPLWFTVYSLILMRWQKERTSRDWQENWGIAAGIGIALFVILAIFTTTGIFSGFLNPEYGALNDITEMLRKATN